MNKFLTLLSALCISAAATAVEPSESVRQLGSNYYAYPYPANPLPELTAAPEGYTPFHIEHYGRHGSRWHIGTKSYTRPIELLEPAEKAGALTPRGQELLAQLREIEVKSRGRDGELTDVGAAQHRGIARRMFSNFPQVFADSARVDARSTVVIRCILSMDNELQELLALNPSLRITSDASQADMRYMNFSDPYSIGNNAAKKGEKEYKNFAATRNYHGDYLQKLVSDPAVRDSINSASLFYYLFNIAANAQSHTDQVAPYDIFSERELREKWEADNASWHQRMGNEARTDGLAPYSQRRLLANLIESADTAIASRKPGANLRFGHEVIVLPLVVLMELDDYGKEYNDFNTLADHWRNYEIFPMACNVQMIFYGNDNDPSAPVLVKVLLNEREVRLPVAPAAQGAPYYDWNDLKSYYQKKLARVDF